MKHCFNVCIREKKKTYKHVFCEQNNVVLQIVDEINLCKYNMYTVIVQ